MRILALIPARGGSKGVPRKNVRLLAGKPVIAYTIEAAKNSECFEKIFVSTDDKEIADVSKTYGIDVPVLRPATLASDKTPMIDVIQYVIQIHKENGFNFDAVCLLQPTNPLRKSSQIQEAVTIFQHGNFDSLISVLEVPQKYNPHWVYIEKEKGSLSLFTGDDQPIARRQDLPVVFIREGSIYLFKVKNLDDYENIYGKRIGYYLVKEESVNIDSPEDFIQAERILLNGTDKATNEGSI